MASYSRPGVTVTTSLTPLASSPGNGTAGSVACFAAPSNIGPTSPVLVTSWQQFVASFGGFQATAGQALAYAVYQYFANGGSACYVVRAPNTDALKAAVTIDSITEITSGTPNPILTLTATNPGAAGNSTYYEIVPQGTGTDNTTAFTLNIYQGGTAPSNLVESWPSVSMNPASTRYIMSLVNSTTGGSQYVAASLAYTGTYVTGGEYDPISNAGSPTPLAGGSDGDTPMTDSVLATAITTGYVGTTWSVTGFSSLPGNIVLNVNVPGADVAVLNAVAAWGSPLGNVFLIADGPYIGATATSATVAAGYTSLVSGSSGTVLTGGENVIVYGPWLSIADPASSSPTATKWVAPGGAVLGQWAANDAAYNVAQTPAGVQATVSAVALEAYFSATDLNNLEAVNVNPIKVIPNAGYCIFGGRTQATGYPTRYINVARTLAQFTVDFQSITAYAIFQNNDPTLWASIANTLTNYLNTAMQDGMLASSTASSAFSVVCDSTINTSATAQAGIVNAQVQVALVSPAEFITITLSQTASGSSTTVSS